MTEPPAIDADIPAYWRSLGLPGLIDTHTHFLPRRMQEKVWAYFDRGSANYGTEWPVVYRLPEAARVELLRSWGVRAFPSLPYPHKPGMAAWLNDEALKFAAGVPEVLPSATFFPEPEALSYVTAALDAGARIFKVHVQIGGFDPRDEVLAPVWGLLAEASVPVVVHCGSGPLRGAYTGPGPFGEVLAAHPALVAVIAHAGMPDYGAFLDLAAAYQRVYLDTTMVATDFTESLMPLPAPVAARYADFGDRILFGSDFPSIPHSYAHQLASIHRLGFGSAWLRAVLHDNAAALFGIG
ncbi:amidohydrolase family protein [Fodinicola acaciae]|uniref:amidohydrolase family protein n=1 Tax=Fodinicola acaciae TaxID=2681555 RepID=UPI0013D37CCE|nr:amidohydrolase family protein [Fodinicola acaciae]